MSRLIDADAFAEKIKEISIRQGYYDFHPKSMSVGEILDSVIAELNGEGVCGFENAPTVDAVPVMHGHWRRGKSYPHNIYCSNCFRTYVPNEEIELWKDQTLPRKYCPECGALMDEVTE